jgi:hypothetical protein
MWIQKHPAYFILGSAARFELRQSTDRGVIKTSDKILWVQNKKRPKSEDNKENIHASYELPQLGR